KVGNHGQGIDHVALHDELLVGVRDEPGGARPFPQDLEISLETIERLVGEASSEVLARTLQRGSKRWGHRVREGPSNVSRETSGGAALVSAPGAGGFAGGW